MTPEERRRIVTETREIVGEALTSHALSDDECERALLDLDLDDAQAALEQLQHKDPVGSTWFDHDDGWLDKQLGARQAHGDS